MTPEEIYANFQGGTGTVSQQGGHANVRDLSTQLPEHADDVQRIKDGVQQAWTGDAAEAAVSGLSPIADGLMTTGGAADTGQGAISGSIDAYHLTASKVVPMPPKPALQDPLNVLFNGGQTKTMFQQATAYQDAANTNVTAMQQYDQTVSSHLGTLPPVDTTAPPAPAPGGANSIPVSVQVAPPAGSTRAPSVSGRTGSGSSGGAGSTATPPYSGGSARPVGPVGAPQPPAPVNPVNTSTGTSSYTGQPGLLNPVANPAPGGVPISTAAPGPDPSYTGNIAGILAGEQPPAGLPGEGGIGGKAGIGGGSAGGAGGLGDEPTPKATPGAGAGGPGSEPEPGTGGRSGVAPTTMADEAMTEGGAAAKPGAGMAGGGMGGARGGNSEDAEHKRKYDIHADPALFYNQTPTAPQVLGETEAEYEARIARDSGQKR
jgi:hypothetical protein